MIQTACSLPMTLSTSVTQASSTAPPPSTLSTSSTSSSTQGLPTSCSSAAPQETQNPYASVSENCAGPSLLGRASSNILSCGSNSTLFQILAPIGTPHSNGQAPSDLGGWQTWSGGGCACESGRICCTQDAGTCLPMDQINGEVADQPGPNASPLDVFSTLGGSCTCNG